MSTDSVQPRRRFLRAGLATAGGFALGACGGGSDVAAATDTVDQGGVSPGAVGGSVSPQVPGGPGTYVVQATSAQPEVFAPGTTIQIASGARGMLAQVSPDLPPGRTLALSAGGDVSIVSAIDSPVSTIDRPWVIEVMDSPIATIYNRTQGTTFGKVYNGTTWWQCINAATQGDVIEISPGAINETEADCTNYFNGLDACGMVIVQGVTVRNIPGRGRWRLFPAGATIAAARSGINVYGPAELGDYGATIRKTIVIEGFDITDQWGTMRDAYGLRLRSGAPSNSWNGVHSSVTVRNFKLGKTSGHTGSGLQGGAEILTYEDGHIFDCGQGGYEHNAYINGKTLTLRGMRSTRSRDNGTPGAMDGHLLKVAGEVILIEGCALYADGAADNSAIVHFYHGGNCTIRSSLLVQGATPTNGKASIWYEEQDGPYNVPPPFYYGAQGHSLLLEKNVFISRPTTAPMVWFAMGRGAIPITAGNVVVRDNIAAYNTIAPTAWFLNPPSPIDWVTRGNSIETYDQADSAFADKVLKRYTRAAGPVAGSGSVATKRFVWPHGCIDRTDAYRGLA